jgi:hypothetical protein
MATDEQLIALQREQELATDDEDAARAAARAERLDIHTALPGIVKSFDRAALTVKVQPAIKRRWIDTGFEPLPECVNVPVQFPRFGNFIIIGPVAVGDEGLVHFAERAIDQWHAKGGVQEAEFRLHDLSDGFFAPGYSSLPKAAEVAGGAPDALEIRTLDGTTLLRVEAGKVYVGHTLLAEPTLRASTYRLAETALDNTILGALAPLLALATAMLANTTELATFAGTYPTIGPFIVGLATFLPLWQAAVAAFEAQGATFPTTMAMVR